MNICTNKIAIILASLASIGTDEQIKSMGITNGRVASPRTISLDLPDGKYEIASEGSQSSKPINRVKITAHSDGTATVRLIEMTKASTIVPIGEIVEHESIGPIPTNEVGMNLAQKIGLGV